MAEVFVIMNQKGGVGKTTTAINLAAGLKLCDMRVLCVDIDAQAHLSKFANAEIDRPTVLELLDGRVNFSDAVQHTAVGDLIPSKADLDGYQMSLSIKPSALFLIKKMLRPVLSDYDYIIIDCPPAINQLTLGAMVAANSIVIPTEAEFFSIDGVTMLMSNSINEIKEYHNKDLKVAGFLLVKYKPWLREVQAMTSVLETVAKDYFDTKIFDAKIRAATAVPTSQRAQKNIFEFDPSSGVAKDYLSFIGEVIDKKACQACPAS